MDWATDSAQSRNSAMIDFALELFEALGYAKIPMSPKARMPYSLLICGKKKNIQLDIALLDITNYNVLMIMQEDQCKCSRTRVDPVAHLVAAAIAAFRVNNDRRKDHGLEILQGVVCVVSLAPIIFTLTRRVGDSWYNIP